MYSTGKDRKEIARESSIKAHSTLLKLCDKGETCIVSFTIKKGIIITENINIKNSYTEYQKY